MDEGRDGVGETAQLQWNESCGEISSANTTGYEQDYSQKNSE